MISSKQRAYLRGKANNIRSIFQIGKDGITKEFVSEINDVLEARELIKINVLKNSLMDVRDACTELSQLTNSEIVQVIGRKFVLYKESENNKTIELP